MRLSANENLRCKPPLARHRQPPRPSPSVPALAAHTAVQEPSKIIYPIFTDDFHGCYFGLPGSLAHCADTARCPLAESALLAEPSVEPHIALCVE